MRGVALCCVASGMRSSGNFERRNDSNPLLLGVGIDVIHDVKQPAVKENFLVRDVFLRSFLSMSL